MNVNVERTIGVSFKRIHIQNTIIVLHNILCNGTVRIWTGNAGIIPEFLCRYSCQGNGL